MVRGTGSKYSEGVVGKTDCFLISQDSLGGFPWIDSSISIVNSVSLVFVNVAIFVFVNK